MVGIEDLDVGPALDVAGTGHARAFLLEHHALDAVGVLPKRDLLDVEDDVGNVLAHAGNRRELVQHAIDMHRGDGGALQRRQQHAAKRIAEREPKAALKRFGDDRGETLRVARTGNDVELGGLDKILPVLLQHLVSPFLVHERGCLPQLPRILVQHVLVSLAFLLDAPALAWPAAVMRDRRYVAN